MSQILVPSRRVWTRQPTASDAVIAQNSRSSADLADAFLGGHRFSLVTGRPLSLSGTWQPKATRSGIGNSLPASASASISGQVVSQNGIASGATLLFYGINPAYGGYPSGVNKFGGTNGIRLETVGSAFQAVAEDATSTVVSYTPPSLTDLALQVAVFDGSALSFWVNGILRGQSAATVGTSTNSSLRAPNSSYTSVNYRALLVAAWNRALSDAEVRALSDNPWQLFKPRRRVAIFDMAAGGSGLAAQASGAGQSSGSADLHAQVALAGVGVSLASGQTTPSVAIPLSAAGISVAGGSANGIATVSLSAAGLAQAAGQAGLSASVLLAAAGAAQAAGNTALAALLNAQAAGAGQAGGSANLTGGAPGALNASGGDVASGSAVLSVSVKLQATGSGQAGGSANGMASAPGALSASGQANAAGFATWSALVTLTAAGFVQAMGAGSFQVSIPLSAGGTAQASGVAQASMAGLVNRFALQAREKCLTETTTSVWRVALIETDIARMTRLVHEVKHV